jgi:maltose alpha-D-glucosyltransferase/alpha-amylase
MTTTGPGGRQAGRDGGQAIRAMLPAVLARLPGFLPAQRWFGNKERAVDRVEIRDTAVMPDHPSTLLTLVDIFSGSSAPVSYFLPLSLAGPADAGEGADAWPPGEVVARSGDRVVRDGIADAETCRTLLRGMLNGQTLPTAAGGRFLFQPARRREHAETAGESVPGVSATGASGPGDLRIEDLAIRHAGVEQSNSSVIFGQALILKALRRLADGINPEIEIPRFLGEHTTFDRVPALVGWAEYQGPGGSSAPVGVLQQFVANQGDGWSWVLRQVSRLGGQAGQVSDGDSPVPGGDGLASALAELGRTLAELHLALASGPDVPEFAPEPISADDLGVWRARTLASLDEILARVGRGLAASPAGTGWSAQDRRFGEAVQAGADRLRAAIDGIGGLADGRTVKTRHHGDFHLGQTLVSDGGWVLIDFEGEPLRSLAERRAKQTPLRDVAGLLRSLDYAHATAIRQAPGADQSMLAGLFERCRQAVLGAYVETIRAGDAPLLPARPEDLTRALVALELEKALYELTYELGNRPDWVSIPLSALARFAATA